MFSNIFIAPKDSSLNFMGSLLSYFSAILLISAVISLLVDFGSLLSARTVTVKPIFVSPKFESKWYDLILLTFHYNSKVDHLFLDRQPLGDSLRCYMEILFAEFHSPELQKLLMFQFRHQILSQRYTNLLEPDDQSRSRPVR